MTRKKISKEKCSYMTVTLTKEVIELLEMQKKIDPRFNFSAWVRDKVFQDFSEEDSLKKMEDYYLNKAKEAENILKNRRKNQKYPEDFFNQ
jgi:hypothetical protein